MSRHKLNHLVNMRYFMRFPIILITLLFSLSLISFSSSAQWYETQGSARIDKYSVDTARS